MDTSGDRPLVHSREGAMHSPSLNRVVLADEHHAHVHSHIRLILGGASACMVTGLRGS